MARAGDPRPGQTPVSPRSRRSLGLVLGLAALGLAACTSEEEKPLSGEAAEARALSDIREVFATRVLGDGSAAPGWHVGDVTRDGIDWTLRGGFSGGPFTLAWADVEDVEGQEQSEKPARPETVYLYLARGSPSVRTALVENPPLSGEGLVRSYVVLRDAPRGSRSRLARALDLLRRRRVAAARSRVGAEASPAFPSSRTTPAAPTPAPSAEPAPVTSASVEARLRQLKEWHEKGLIDDEVYREEQRKALGGF